MDGRRGERLGWTVGFLGGSAWLLGATAFCAWSGKLLPAIGCLGLFLLTAGLIVALAPWKHPSTRYWKLMTPILVMQLAPLPVALRIEGLRGAQGMPWTILIQILLFAVVMPMAMIGRKRWADHARPAGLGNQPETPSSLGPIERKADR